MKRRTAISSVWLTCSSTLWNLKYFNTRSKTSLKSRRTITKSTVNNVMIWRKNPTTLSHWAFERSWVLQWVAPDMKGQLPATFLVTLYEYFAPVNGYFHHRLTTRAPIHVGPTNRADTELQLVNRHLINFHKHSYENFRIPEDFYVATAVICMRKAVTKGLFRWRNK